MFLVQGFHSAVRKLLADFGLDRGFDLLKSLTA